MSLDSTLSVVRSVMRSRWVKILQSGVTLLLIGWLFTSVDREVWSRLMQVSWTTLLSSVVVFSSAQVFGGLRLAALAAGSIHWRDALTVTWSGYFWGNFLPGSVGGDLVRAFRLRNSGMRLSHITGLLIVDRLFNLTVIAGGLAVAIIPLSRQADIDFSMWFLPVLFCLGLGMVFLLVLLKRRPPTIVAAAFEPLLVTVKNTPRIFLVICLSLASIGVSILSQWLLAVSLGMNVSLLVLAGIICLVTLFVMLPISINGLGLQEASFVTLLVSVGVTEEKAIAFSLLVRFMILASGALAGLITVSESIRCSIGRGA